MITAAAGAAGVHIMMRTKHGLGVQTLESVAGDASDEEIFGQVWVEQEVVDLGAAASAVGVLATDFIISIIFGNRLIDYYCTFALRLSQSDFFRLK